MACAFNIMRKVYIKTKNNLCGGNEKEKMGNGKMESKNTE